MVIVWATLGKTSKGVAFGGGGGGGGALVNRAKGFYKYALFNSSKRQIKLILIFISHYRHSKHCSGLSSLAFVCFSLNSLERLLSSLFIDTMHSLLI